MFENFDWEAIKLAAAQLFVLAILVQALVERIKPFYVRIKVLEPILTEIHQGLSIALGIGLSFLAGTDLFKLLQVPLSVSWVSFIATGILISRGANGLHDIFKAISDALGLVHSTFLKKTVQPQDVPPEG